MATKSQQPMPDDKGQSRAFIETAREIGADEVLGRLAKRAPEPK